MAGGSESVRAESAKSMRSEIARVRGLGSAKDGTHHWWVERLSALALVPLSIWLVASLVWLAGADQAAIALWLGSPFTVGAFSLLIIAAFYHAALGVQVVLQDYVHGTATQFTLVILVQFAAFALSAAAIVALLVVAFAG